MKKLLIIILFYFTTNFAFSQQFKFYLAFEDSTTAKDTVWFVWDSTTTYQIDSTFNELPIQIPNDTFQVFFKFYPFDTTAYYTKVFSAPSSSKTFSSYVSVKKINNHNSFKLPLSIKWDTTLLINNNLPFQLKLAALFNYYITQYDTIPNNQYIDMLHNGNTVIPYISATSNLVFNSVCKIIFSAWGYGYDDQQKSIGNLIQKTLNIENKNILLDNQRYNRILIYDVTGLLINEYLHPSNKISLKYLPPGYYKIVLEKDNNKYFDFIILK